MNIQLHFIYIVFRFVLIRALHSTLRRVDEIYFYAKYFILFYCSVFFAWIKVAGRRLLASRSVRPSERWERVEKLAK